LNEICRQVIDKNKHVIIRGFTDDRGALSYNTQLSRRRAQAVGDYLKQCGLKSSDIIGEGVRVWEDQSSAMQKRDKSRAVSILMTIQQ
jgi:outer membrane protein OmpA-like peptidoglycan-associated protein